MDRKVRFRITADIKGFNKAIKQVNKALEEMLDSAKALNKSKFGDSIEKQLKKTNKQVDKLQDSLEDINKSLKNIQKVKLDKQIKNFNKIEKSSKTITKNLKEVNTQLKKVEKVKLDKQVKNLNKIEKSSKDVIKNLKDTQKQLEKIQKTKLDKLTKQIKEINELLDDMQDVLKKDIKLFDSLEKVKLDKIVNALEDASDAVKRLNIQLEEVERRLKSLSNIDINIDVNISNINNEIRDLVASIERCEDSVDGLSASFDRLNAEIRDISDASLSRLNGDIVNLKNRVQSLVSSFRQLKSELSNIRISNVSLSGLESSISEVSSDIKTLNSDIKTMNDTLRDTEKIGFNGVLDDMSKMASAGEKVSKVYKDINSTLKSLKANSKLTLNIDSSTGKKGGGILDSFINAMSLNEINDVNRGLLKLNDAAEKSARSFNEMKESIRELAARSQLSSLGRDISEIGDEINYATKEFANFNNEIKDNEALIEKINNYSEKLKNKINELSTQGFISDKDMQKVDRACQRIRELYDECDRLGISIQKVDFDSLAEELRKAYNASNRADDAFSETCMTMEDTGSAATALSMNLQLLARGANESSNIFSKVINKIKEFFSNMKNTNKAIDQTNQELDDSADKVKKLSDAYDKAVDDLKRYEEALKDNNDALDKAVQAELENADAIKETKQELSMMKDMLKEAYDIFNKYDSEDLNMFEDLDHKARRITELREEIKKLESGIESLNNSFKDNNGIAEEVEELNLLKSTLQSFYNVIANRKDKEILAYEEIKEMAEWIERLKDEIAILEYTLDHFDNESRENVQTIKELSEMHEVLAEGAKETREAMERLEQELADSNDGYERQEDAIKDATDSLEKYEDAAKEAEDATEKLADAQEDAGNSSEKWIDSLKGVKDIFDKIKSGDLGGAFKAFKDMSFDGLAKGVNNLGTWIANAGSKLAQFGAQAAASGSKFGGMIIKAGAGIKGLGTALAGVSATAVATFAAVAVAIAAVIAALNKLYNAGKQQFFGGLSNIKDKFQPVINAIKKVGTEFKQVFERVTGVELEFDEQIVQVVEFDYAIQRAGATCKASGKQMEELSNKARELGAATKFTSAEVADAFYYMALAGWQTSDMLEGIDSVLKLANVSGMELAETCDIITDYLGAFGLTSKDAADFVDHMAVTSTSTNTTVSQLASAYNNCAAAAAEFGVSQTFLNTQLGILANSGRKGSSAGTALKNMYSNLLSPTSDDALKMYQKWGIYVGDKLNPALVQTNALTGEQEINTKALNNQLREQYRNLDTVSEKSTFLKTIWGKLSMSAGATLMSASDLDYERLELVQKTSDAFGRYLNQQYKVVDAEGNLVSSNGKVIKSMSDIDETTKKNIDTVNDFYDVYQDIVDAQWASVLNTTNKDIGAAILKLGADGKVAAEDVEDFLNVIEAIKNPTDKAAKAMQDAGFRVKDLSDELVYAEDGTLDLAASMDKLTPIFKDMGKENVKAMLSNMGLADSWGEVEEAVWGAGSSLSEYKKQLGLVTTATEDMSTYFEGTLKDKLKVLGSAISEVFLSMILPAKDSITKVIDSFSKFFADLGNIIKKNGKSTTQDLINTSKEWGKGLEQGIVGAVSGIEKFINGGGLKTALDIGTNIIQGICDGIMKAKNNGSLDKAIDGFITNISDWIVNNGDDIIEAGETIIDSITEGIERNEGAITDAMNTICDAITTWASSSGKLKASAGLFAEQFVGLALENMWIGFKTWIGEKFKAFGELFDSDNITFGTAGVAGNLIANICEGIFGKNPVEGIKKWAKEKFKNFNLWQTIKDFFLPTAYADSPGDSSSQIKPEQLIKIPSLDDIKGYIKEKIGNFDVKGFIKNLLVIGSGPMGGVANAVMNVADLINIPSLGEIKEYITSKFSGFSIKDFIKTLLIGGATGIGGAGAAAGGALFKAADLFGDWNPIEDIKGWLDEKIGDWGITKWFKEKFGNKDGKGEKVDVGELLQLDPTKLAEIENSLNSLSTTASTVATNVVTAFNNITNNARTQFTNLSNIARNQFVNLANIVRNQMVNSANIVRNQCVNMANIFRNQFTSMSNVARNQMVNVSNIIRNQAVNWSNIIRNQVQNARNALTSSFLSMAAVARTQMVNISNIVRNQAVNWANIIRNQSANMKAAFSSAFSGLAAVAARGMAACLSTVRSYMSQIKAATAQTMTMNFKVNRSISTTNTVRTVTAPAAAASVSTFGLYNAYDAINTAGHMATYATPNTQTLARSASTAVSRTAGGSSSVPQKENVSIEIPVKLDGREVARATAVYMNGELKKIETRSNRRRGE